MKDIKWFWKMDYCKSKAIPPAQNWAWKEADREYDKFLKVNDLV